MSGGDALEGRRVRVWPATTSPTRPARRRLRGFVLALGTAVRRRLMTGGRSRTGSRERRRRRAGAGVALLLLAAALPGRAQAVEFVSNLERSTAALSSDTAAQTFTTGSNSTGYTVTGVRLRSTGTAGFSASLYTTDADGDPDEELAALTAPATFANRPANFAAPAGTVLAPDTVYAVVVRDGRFRVGTISADGQRGHAGWSIGDAYRFRQGESWTINSSGDSLMMAVDGIVGTNRPSTGLGIAGTGRVGQTLAADTSGLADPDGLAGVSYRYQWFHLDGGAETAIPGATSPTYMPVTSDFGRRVGMRVSFTDETGFPESIASPAVTVRAAMPPAACPAFTVPAGRERVWTGTLTVGEIASGQTVTGHGFSGDTGGLSAPRHFELSGTRYTVDGAYAAAASATPPGALRFSLDGALTDVQAANLRLHVCGESRAFADAAFDTATHSYAWPHAGLDWSGLAGRTRELHLTLSPDAAPTGLPVVSGPARVGRTVAASTAGIRDANGLAGVSWEYQWIRVDGGTETEIAGGTEADYVLTADDEGKQVRVKVTFTDDATYEHTLTSAKFPADGTIAMPADPSTVAGNVWQAELTVADLSTHVPPARGCDNATSGKQCFTSTVLTDDDFTLERPGEDLDQGVFAILLSGTTLTVRFTKGPFEGYEVRSLVFRSGSRSFRFSDAQYNSGVKAYTWTNTGLGWSAGDSISLAIGQLETDNTPPALAEEAEGYGVAADGRSIRLVFDEALDHANRPAKEAFTVTAGGSAVPVTGVSGGASWLRLALGSVIVQDQAVTVRYADPTKGDAVALQDAAGNEAADFTVTVTNGSTVPGVPGAPTGLTAVAGLPDPPDGTTQVALSWDAPADAGHSAITGYRIEWSPDGNDPWTELVADTGSTDRSHTDEGLPSNFTRHYRVSARNALGPGGPSAAAGATTADIVPPVLVRAEVQAAGDRIALTFDETLNPGAPPRFDSFVVTADGVRIGLGGLNILVGGGLVFRDLSQRIRRGQEVVLTYADPTPGDDRNAVQDLAENDAAGFTTGEGGVPAIVNNSAVSPTAPGKVPMLVAEATGDTSIALAWEAPADDGGRPVASYRIEWSADGSTGWTELVAEHARARDGEIDRRHEDEDLDPGVTRHYRVRARNEVNHGAWSDAASATTPTGVPGAPTGLTATAADAMQGDAGTAVRLAWTEPSNPGLSAISGYGIEWSADGNAPWNEVVADTGSTATEYIDGGLGSEETRHYRVRAINGEGPGSASDTAEATTADIVPPVPVSAAVTATGRTVQFSFTETFDGNGARLLPKNAFRVTADGIQASIEGDIDSDTSGAATMLLLTTITPPIRQGQTVVVTYTDPTAGDDAFVVLQDVTGNDAASFTTGAEGVPAVVNGSTVAPVAPGKVPNLAAVPGGSTAIVLTWDAPADNGGRVIASYRIEGCASACETESNWEVEVDEHDTISGGAIERRWVDAGLAAATTRHYRVRAKNEVNAGAWSDSASATTATAGTPEAPTGLTATAQDADRADGATEIALAWTRPGNQGDSNVAGYRVEWSADGSTDWTELEEDTGTTATAFIDDMLGSETTRHYRVSAINTQGTGPTSGTAHATTADVASPVLVRIFALPSELNIEVDEPLDFTAAGSLPADAVTVTASGDSVSGDVLLYSDSPRGVSFVPHQRPFRQGETIVVTYTDPTPGDDATGVIQDLAGNDAASFTSGEDGVPAVEDHSSLAPIVPGKVRNLAAAPVSGTSVALAWDAPADNGGRPVASYRIDVSTDGGITFTEAVATHNEMQGDAILRRYVHTVPEGATRHYRVAARNSVGLGAWSDTAGATAVTGAPDAPTGLTATAEDAGRADGETEIALAWTRPADQGDSNVTGYRVEWSADGRTDWTELEDDTGTTATAFIDGMLGSEVTRHYRVSAINTQGTGPPSVSAHATTADVAGPVPVSAAVHESGNLLRITFDEALDDRAANLPQPGRFQVTAADGTTFTVSSVAVLRADGVHKVVGLFFPAGLPVREDQVLTVAYSDRTANDDAAGVVQDDDGNDAEGFTLGPDGTVSVTNGSMQAVSAPGTPESLQAASGGNDRIVVTWDAPADTGGRAITGYRIEASSQGAGGPFTVLVESHNAKNAAGRFEYVHRDLMASDQRWYRITARNGPEDDDVGPVSEVRQGAVDKKGDVALSVAAARVAEGGAAVWTVTAVTDGDEAPESALSMEVRVTSADGTATAPDDYAAVDAMVTFQRADFTRRNVQGVGFRHVAEKTGRVAIVDDVTVEPEKAFSLAMAVGTGGTGWVTGTDGVGITLEDDDAWTVAVSADPPSLVEGENREVTLTARIARGDGSAPPGDGCVIATAVEVALAVAGTAAGEGIDYTLGGETGAREIAACAHEASWTVRLDTAVDRVDDADETVTFTPVLESGHAIAPAALSAATVTLRQEPGVRVSRDSLRVSEGGGRSYAVSLTAPPDAAVTVTARVRDNPDVSVSPQSLAFTPADWHVAQTVTVSAADDADEEDDTATVEHLVSGAGGYAGVTAGSVAVAVRDTSGANEWGAVRLGDAFEVAGEGTVGRLEVAYHGEWGTVCDDRQFLGNLTPVLACRIAGYASGEHERNRNSAEFNAESEMRILLDDVMCLPGEHDDAVRLDQCAARYPGTAHNCRRSDDMWVKCTGTLPDGQSPAIGSMPKLLVGDAGTSEDFASGTLAFTVLLTPAASSEVTVRYATRDVPGTGPLAADFSGAVPTRATAGEDYTPVPASANRRLAFAPGETSKTIEVAITDDSVEDSNEMFQVVLSEATGGALIADGVGEGLIFNHDPLEAGFENVPRAHGGAAFTVTLAFSRSVTANAARVRAALETIGGTLVQVTGPDSEGRRFEVRVRPDGSGKVTVLIASEEDCAAARAVCDEDGVGLDDTVSVVVVHSVAAPVIAGAASFTVGEGETAVATLTATDDETAAEDLVWSIPTGADGGADAGMFTLSAGGVLAFVSGKDFEAPDDADADGTYEVTVAVSDGTNTTTKSLEVTLAALAPGAPHIAGITPVFWRGRSVGWNPSDPHYPSNTGPDYPYHIRPPDKLVVGWAAPSSDGGSPITQWKVQWKSGTEAYDAVRQKLLPAATRAPAHTGRLVPGEPVPDYSAEIAGLEAGTDYTFRVVAVNDQGEGSPSDEASGTTPAARGVQETRLLERILDAYSPRWAWLRSVRSYLERNGIPVVFTHSGGQYRGRVETFCRTRFPTIPYGGCKVTEVRRVLFDTRGVPELDPILVLHEFAHVYSLATDLGGGIDTGPIAIAHLYLDRYANTRCSATELYADYAASVTYGVRAYLPYANSSCNYGVNGADRDTAIAVVASSLDGAIPAWFRATFRRADGTPDLERFWDEVRRMSHVRPDLEFDQVDALRNSFGGYCDWEKAAGYVARFSGHVSDVIVRNPWRDGGCVPDAPGSLTAQAGGDGRVALAWETPDSDGGSPVLGYRVQWKSGSEEYGDSREEVIRDPLKIFHAITDLTDGTEYTVRVAANNGYGGEGGWAEAAVTPSGSDTTAPAFQHATVDATTLTLAYDETLDRNSTPPATAFSVLVGAPAVGRTPAAVSVEGSDVTLTLETQVWSGEAVAVSYVPPTGSDARPLLDSAGNPAAALTGAAVENLTFTGTVNICSRTAQVRNVMLTALKGLMPGLFPTCEAVPAATVKLIDTLNLRSWWGLTSLKVDDFDGLEGLRTLYLARTGLTTLPVGVFGGLHNLERIDLRNSRLTTLPDGIFEGLPSLQQVQLSGNPGFANFGPVARAGEDRAGVATGATVVLDGSGSDGGPWGSDLVYEWQQIDESGVQADLQTRTTGRASFAFPDAPDDTVLEFRLSVRGRADAERDLVSTDTVRVAAGPRISIAAATSPVTEGTAARFTLSRSGDPASELTVSVNVTETGSVLDGPPPATAVFAAGARETAFVVASADDALEEASSRITAEIGAGDGYAAKTGAGSAEVEVADNDTAVLEVSVEPAEVAEGETATLALAVAGGVAFSEDQTFTLDFAGSTATVDEDFTVASRSLVLPAGAGSAMMAVAVLADTLEEPAETLTISMVRNGTAVGTATLIVAASDAGLPSLVIADGGRLSVSVQEGETAVVTLVDPRLERSVRRGESGAAVWSITAGADADQFTLTAAGGLSFKTAKDYEAPDDADADGAYELKVRATGEGQAVESVLTVRIVDVEELAPSLSDGIANESDATVHGTAQVGETLRVSVSGLEKISASERAALGYQWVRSDGTADATIVGATGASYVLTTSEVGQTIKVLVTVAADGEPEKTITSAATAPVWPAPSNPPLASGEEELLSAVVTLQSFHGYPVRFAGYGDLSQARFGGMDETDFDDDGTARAVSLIAVNEMGEFMLATGSETPGMGGLVAYWNGHRISMSRSSTVTTDRIPTLVGENPQPREDYLRYMDGGANGVRVAVSLRRTVAAVHVTSAAVTSAPGDNGTWDEDETVAAEVRFDAPVTVTGGPPTLALLLDAARREAAYTGGSGTDTLSFALAVTGDDAGARRARLASNGLRRNGATLSAGDGVRVDTAFAVAPWVTQAAIAPDASGDREWTAGETIEARLAFSEAVTVAGGSPWLEVNIGAGGLPVFVAYASGSGTDTLVFSTEWPAGAGGVTGLAVAADSLTASGGSIVSASSGLAAALGHDGTEPTAAPGEGPAEPLTATLREVPQTHDGSAFSFGIAFSEDVALDMAMLAATNGEVSALGQATPGDGRAWDVTVTPGGAGDVTVTVPARACAEADAACTADGRGLEADVSATVSAEVPGEEPFVVSIVDVPEEHDGATPVVFEVAFTKNPPGYSYKTMRDLTLDIRHGNTRFTATQARRLDKPRSDRWEITVTPRSKADLKVSIGPFASCSDIGAVCAAGGEVLANGVKETILGPPGLSVADAEVDENTGDPVAFAVTLGRASRHTVTVDYATSDGTAVAGEDYEETSGTLTFAPGVTERTVSVPVIADSHDESRETFTLTLSNPDGGNAWLEEATATGTIVNTDHMPRAWLARFGRTVAEQVLEAVEGRFAAQRRSGVEFSLAGEALGTGGEASGDARRAASEEAEARSRLAAMTRWLRGADEDGQDGRRDGLRAVTARDLLTGSSFSLTGEAKAGGLVSLWGRGAVSRFDGRDGDLTLSGEVTSVMMGADWSGGPGSKPGAAPAAGRGAWTAGLLLSRSGGAGSYRGEGEGTVSSTLTGLYPYGRYAASERVTVWGVAGYGAGELVLTPENAQTGAAGPAMTAGMELMMGAAGLRGTVVEAPAEGGVELSVKSDAMMVRTSSEKTTGLEGARASVTRLRLGLEGTWRGLEAGGGTLAPRVEAGVRHDGGDAETGFGLDLGGGLAWSNRESGLSIDASGRGLLTREAGGFRDRGFSGSLAWDPGGGSGRGPKLTLTQTVGGSSSGGADALLGQRHLGGLAANDNGDGGDDLANRRLELRFGYGHGAFGDRFTATPELGLGLSGGQRDYTLGWRLGLVSSGSTALEFRLEGTRREADNDIAPAEHGVRLGLTARW